MSTTPTLCQFARVPGSLAIRCVRCGKIVQPYALDRDPETFHAVCGSKVSPAPRRLAPDDVPCVHRGELVRVGACDLCGDKGQPFEILGCGIHGECSVSRRHSKVKACVACPDRVSPAE